MRPGAGRERDREGVVADGYKTYLVAALMVVLGVWVIKQGQSEAGMALIGLGLATASQRRATAQVEKKVEALNE